MEQYAPNMMELASRDVVSRAEQIEINEGRGINGCVLLDCRHLGKGIIRERLSQIFEEAKSFANIDLTEEPIPVCPGMHYMMGGVKTDVEGRCWDLAGGWRGVPGLFAAGEAACLSLHGGNRLGANSLLDTVVFGRRAGRCAGEYAKTRPQPRIGDGVVKDGENSIKGLFARPDTDDTVARIRHEMGRAMTQNLGVFRDQEGMAHAQQTIAGLRERWNHRGYS